MAPKFDVLETGAERRTVALDDGATIAGRLVQNGEPVPNAHIGLIAKNRGGFASDLRMMAIPMK